MRQLLTDCWALDIPEEFDAERDEETVILTDDDNISTLEITAIRKQDGEVTGEELASFAEDLNAGNLPRKEVMLGDFDGFVYEYIEDNYWCRDWFVSFKDVCLLVSYTCLEDDKHFDDTAIDNILDSISYLPLGALDKQ